MIYLSLVFSSNSIAIGLTRISYQVLRLIKDTLLLASVATCDRKHRTTTDWIEFITSDTTCNGNFVIWLSILRMVDIKKVVQFIQEMISCYLDKVESHEVHYLVLYAVEPGIFIAHFIRPEDSFIKLHFLLAIHRALFHSEEILEGKRVDNFLETTT